MPPTGLFLLALLPGLLSLDIPTFTQHPRTQILLPRHRLTLSCTIHLPNTTEDANLWTVSGIHWLLNGSHIDTDRHLELVTIQQPTPSESVLSIERFNQSWDGVYQCRGVLEDGGMNASLLSEPASVTSASMPKLRKTPDQIVETLENQTVLLSCDIPDMYPRPHISFLKEHPTVKIPLSTDKYYTSQQQATLQITAITPSDAGHYRCVYTNPVGGHERKSRQRIHLKLLKTPKNTAPTLRFLTKPPTGSVRVESRANASLECAATGIPVPEVTWERYGGPLPNHSQIIGSNLFIGDFQLDDAGTYVCKAGNGLETIESVRTLQYGAAPHFPSVTPSLQFTVYIGQPFSLTCPVEGSPAPTIQWYHNGLLLPSENDASVDVDMSDVEHSGFYQCFARNEYGTKSRTYLVDAVPEPTTTTTTTTTTPTTTTTTTTTTPTTTTTTSTTTTTEPTTTITEETTTTETTTERSTKPYWEIFDNDDEDGEDTPDNYTTPTSYSLAGRSNIITSSESPATDPATIPSTTTSTTTESSTTTAYSPSDEFTELPEWMPDSPVHQDTIDYTELFSGAELDPPTSSVDDTTSPTKKPKKGKKKTTKNPEYDEEEEDDEDDLLVPPNQPEVERASDTSVLLRWDVPPNDGLDITFFRVQYRDMDVQKDWSTTQDLIPNDWRTYEVTGLTPGHSYRFRIAAVYSNDDNRVGRKSRKFKLPGLGGDTAESVPEETMQPATVASATEMPEQPPVIIGAESTANTITLRWMAPASPVKGYYLHFRELTSTKKFIRHRILDVGSTSYTLTELLPGTSYQIKMQTFNEVASDYSNIFEFSTQPDVVNNTTPSEMRVSNPTTAADEDIFLGANSTQKTSELLYLVLGVVLGSAFLVLLIFMMACKIRQYQAKKKTLDNPRVRNRLRSSSRDLNKERSNTLHTPGYLHPAFSANGTAFAKGQSNGELDVMRPLASPLENDNDSEPDTESVERSVPRSRKASPLDSHSLYNDPNEDIYMPERTTGTFRRPSSAHPAMLPWNDAVSEYSTNTARSVDYMGRRQKLRSQIKPQAQINYFE